MLLLCLWLLCWSPVSVTGSSSTAGPPETEAWDNTSESLNASVLLSPEGTAGHVPLHTEPTAPPDTETRAVTTELPTRHDATEIPVTETDPSSLDFPQLRALPSPVTSVTSLCVCDLLVAQCDVNCCCDPDCTASDFSVFSGCEVSVVKGDSQLCVQYAVMYSISSSNTPERVVQTVEQINPNVFCIQATNYEPALYFINPSPPTESNFDNLLKEFGGVSFNIGSDAQNLVVSTTRYEYGSAIQTDNSNYLKLPAPLGTKVCTDNSPVGFLVSQDFICSRIIQIENCSIPAMTLGTYTKVRILAVPYSSKLVNITIQSIIMKSVNGTLSPGILNDKSPLWDNATRICTDVVLGGTLLITYTDKGEITGVVASFVLGAINSAMLPLEQHFKIDFTQEQVPGTKSTALSGSPGYVAGLPLVAGFKSQSGIIQSSNRFGQLTILKSSSEQNCLSEEGNRAAVLFGYNVVSGCILRYTSSTLCQLAADTALNVLKGQQFPDYVASFGNSQPQNVLDWVPITVKSPTEQARIQDMCKIPVSLELEVKYTKYGSLVNPQANIMNVSQKITHAFIPVLGSETFVPISTFVTFVDVSAPAEPGYKAQPTIDAKLPFDFFYPFV